MLYAYSKITTLYSELLTIKLWLYCSIDGYLMANLYCGKLSRNDDNFIDCIPVASKWKRKYNQY